MKPDIQELLAEGIAAARAVQQRQSSQTQAGPAATKKQTPDPQKEHARQLLLQVVKLDQSNVQAWLWLSTVVDEPDDKITCLNNVLTVDPNNKAAKAGLRAVHQLMAQQQAEDEYPASYDYTAPEEPLPPEEPDVETAVSQPTSQEKCPLCHKSISTMDTTCPHCKVPLVMECPACNTLMDVEWQTCRNCGVEMGNYKLGSVYFTNLALAYHDHNRDRKAIEALRIAETIMPNQPDLYRQIGETQAMLGRTSEALGTLEKAIQLEPQQAGPYITLGRVLQQEGRWDEAEKAYRRAMNAVPNSSETYYALGSLLAQRSRYSQARKMLRRALKFEPQHGPAWSRLGQVYESLNKRAAAVDAYYHAADLLDPESFEGQQVQARLNMLDPQLSGRLARGWGEFARQMAGPVLIVVLAALLDSGMRPWWITGTGWLALLLAVVGAWLWVSGTTMPQNPVVTLFVGPAGVGRAARPVLAILGAIFWLLAIAIILWPIGQSFPEIPTL